MDGLKRKKNESFESFMRRVKRAWVSSGRVKQVKKNQYFDPGKGKNMQRKSALHRLNVASKITYLKKTGRLKEEPGRGFKK